MSKVGLIIRREYVSRVRKKSFIIMTILGPLLMGGIFASVFLLDKVDDEQFLLQRILERKLAELHPERFVPRYSMVSFQRVGYAVAFERGKIQRQILLTLTEGKSDINDIDYALASTLIQQKLEPLHA